ncbi:MAG: hypothetical protein NT159_10975 [Proteobacteria bacterium]|nr:hypothetical protein [Pseudomonadota bacterium]
MTLVTRIRNTEFPRQVRARYPEGVIVSGIHLHIRRRAHVASRTPASLGVFGVMMVIRSVVLGRKMTWNTNGIARRSKLLRVRFVAIAASDAHRVHPALQK